MSNALMLQSSSDDKYHIRSAESTAFAHRKAKFPVLLTLFTGKNLLNYHPPRRTDGRTSDNLKRSSVNQIFTFKIAQKSLAAVIEIAYHIDVEIFKAQVRVVY